VPDVAALAGTYQVPFGGCSLRLTLNAADMTYLYQRQCAAQPAFSNSAGWRVYLRGGEVRLRLDDFRWGFTPGAQEVGVDWTASVSRSWFGLGQPQLCVDLDRGYCFTR
jgi:hypothetical protein